MDLYFYDLELNLLRILPRGTEQKGYTTANFTIDYNGDGKLEISFIDSVLTDLLTQYDELIVSCTDFQGVVTSWITENNKTTIYGYSLNRLMHRHIILGLQTNETVSGTVKSIVYDKLSQMQTDGYYTWLTVEDTDTSGNEIEYSVDDALYGNEWVQELCDKDNCGYVIRADVKRKLYIFEILQASENPLMLSENNLNAYEISQDCDNNNIAVGGWYNQKYADELELDASTGKDENSATVSNNTAANFAKKWRITVAGSSPLSNLKVGDVIGCENESGEIIKIPSDKSDFWHYASLDDTQTGIYKKEIILTADNKTEALSELEKAVPMFQTDLKTRNVIYGTDYRLGDIVRLQIKNQTIRKIIKSIFVSYEGISRLENPSLEDWSEDNE